MQYTIRNVPNHLDAALRSSARQKGKSLNEVTLEALARGAGIGISPRPQRDLRDIAGSWHNDPAFEQAIADQTKSTRTYGDESHKAEPVQC